MKALQECWRILKPGGLLVLSFPTSNHYKDEYREENMYGLKVEVRNSKYFFQRFYDETAIQKRILSNLDSYTIIGQRVYGEIYPNFFIEYERRWQQYGIWETVKDPYYMTKYFKEFKTINDVTGNLSITCLAIRKNL